MVTVDGRKFLPMISDKDGFQTMLPSMDKSFPSPAWPGPFSSLVSNPITRGAFAVWVGYFLISFCTRILLLLTLAKSTVTWDASVAGSFLIGAWFDALGAFFATVPWVVLAGFVAAQKTPAWRWLMVAALVFACWKYLAPHGWPAWVIPSALIIAAAACRFGQRSGELFTVTMACAYVASFLFGAVAEWFFWEEFGVRFNFIAVDYLVYTNEVVANINESYPMPTILTGLALATALVVLIMWKRRTIQWISQSPLDWRSRTRTLLGWVAAAAGLTWLFSQSQLPKFENSFNAELAKNGLYSFAAAYQENEIDYEKFYLTRDSGTIFRRHQELHASSDARPMSNDADDLRRAVTASGPEKKWNVILICVESLSGSFMESFGSKRNLTPNLDRMAKEGVFFTDMYATGTRTIRGMEALTLSVPPTPGQSLVRRPSTRQMFTLGSLFRSRGYDTAFIYGGVGTFDNMNTYFRENGYRVIDRGDKKSAEVTFENAWGACDEDLFRWTISEADAAHAAGKPFHFFSMTTSNHRPFTFPESGVDLKDPKTGSDFTDGRKRTVRYTDYAIHRLIEESRSKPWFASTLFVIVADHCASSAGKEELDVTKFHIPALIWNPILVQPRVYKGLCSQIDLMPTVLGLMNWSYTTRFFGQNVLAPGASPLTRRAFISNYQKVALIRDHQIAILKPKKEFSLYDVDFREGKLTATDAASAQSLLEDAIAYYQSAAVAYKTGKLREDVSAP